MNTFEINDHLRDLKSFKGTYPIDKIKNFKRLEKPFSIVVNLDPHFMPGSHWVALYVDKTQAFYFDSFGRECPLLIKKYLEKFRIKKIIHNRHKFQSLKSQTCGAYTILFLKLMDNGFTFEEILRIFSKDSRKNDDLSIRVLL